MCTSRFCYRSSLSELPFPPRLSGFPGNWPQCWRR
jgi:hypothetical protein